MKRNRSKAFVMSRSILPSTSRKAARDRKRKLHHQNRAFIHQKLTKCHGLASVVVDAYDDDCENLNHCWTPRYMQDWDNIVFDRRQADKLNHFVRWAKRITDNLPQEEKMDFIRPMLPDGLIGQHARSHLYELEPHDPWRHYMLSDEELAQRKATADAKATVRREYDEAIRKALWETAANTNTRRRLNHALYHRTNPNAISYRLMREGNVLWYQRVKGNGIPVIQMKALNGAAAIYELVSIKRRPKDPALVEFLCQYFHITNPLL